ncbi:MAG: hypothetical protein FGM34_06000 [Solirubrobacteraceae bacterium]|nr:hypothetical protein [Solirubrobacteraceae bacterium]
MSFDPVMNAIKNDPELLNELKGAKTPKERAAILDAHGIEKPHADSEFPEMSGAGGSSTPSTATDIMMGASAAGAAL